jgi:predicted transcriptional regulator
MRLSGEWMKAPDDRILEFLQEEGPSSPSEIAGDSRVKFSKSYIATRCKELLKRDFLVQYGHGVYAITDRGIEYLNEEFDASSLDNNNEVRV